MVIIHRLENSPRSPLSSCKQTVGGLLHNLLGRVFCPIYNVREALRPSAGN